MPKRLLQLCSYHSWWSEFVKECFQPSISTLMITQTQIQTSTIIILSPTASIDYYCYHSLVIQLSKYLIENKNLSNKLFILISKSLSDINRLYKPFLLLN
ncbi:unnamed protein product [Rotaria sp. Silwood1]|nr:unnamed protein product [Rotaria sp. Silwood1]CAF4953955.1 unnamed protein product [Rotaria sp. Silwood1]CAF4958579.1 unnamed protein product [Rotaria sp. Silwood1]